MNELAKQEEQTRYIDVHTWEDALNSIDEAREIVSSTDALGDGFAFVEDKHDLIGVPLIVLDWQSFEGSFGGFVRVRAMTKDNRKVAFIDGSTGIMDQLLSMTADPPPVVVAKGGLRVSAYETEIDGKMVPAETFYIDAG